MVVAVVAALGAPAAGCFHGGDEVTGGTSSTAGFTTTTASEETSTSTTTTTTTGTTDDTSTGDATSGPPVDHDAFRVISAQIVDPHCYYQLTPDSCVDSTGILNAGIKGGLDDGSVNMIFVLSPGDPKEPEVGFRVLTGKCNASLDTCAPADGAVVAEATADNTTRGLCNLLLADTFNPDYAADGAPNVPGAPCFVSAEADVRVALSGSLPPIDLVSTQAAATYSGVDGIDGLVKGTLRGYLTESKAKAVFGDLDGFDFVLWGTIAGGGGCQPDMNAPIDDTDPNPDPESAEPGVWLYLNFEAERVEWLE
ncbi:MAG: hypothetical protein R3B09_04475 [Nannocystaceae bacterium]